MGVSKPPPSPPSTAANAFLGIAVEIRQTHIGRIPFNFALISRRSRFRAGTRYFTRGIDAKGHVANFNETEQIVLIDHDDDGGQKSANGGGGGSYGYGGIAEVEGRTKMSFVQTRGSVPVFWAEINNLRYKPDLLVMDRSDTVCPVLPLSCNIYVERF
jgi:hypothetical protein